MSHEVESKKERSKRRIRGIYRLFIAVSAVLVIAVVLMVYFNQENLSEYRDVQGTNKTPVTSDPKEIVDGIHVQTGLIAAEGFTQVVQNCTTCHSAQLVMQNRMTKERWEATIRWMQETQNLWDLGENQEIIIDYLVKNYPPKKKGRREGLSEIQWYTLEQ